MEGRARYGQRSRKSWMKRMIDRDKEVKGEKY